MESYPVVMPEGEWDLIPFAGGKLSLGATHENDMGFDLTVDETLLQQMEEAALPHYPALAKATSRAERVGIRAYTRDFSPFFGQVPELAGVYAASGLGSSGLTMGPIIGYHLAQLVQGKELTLDPVNYPIENYVKRVKANKHFTGILASPLGWQMTFPIKNDKIRKIIRESRKEDARKDFGDGWGRFYRDPHCY